MTYCFTDGFLSLNPIMPDFARNHLSGRGKLVILPECRE